MKESGGAVRSHREVSLSTSAEADEAKGDSMSKIDYNGRTFRSVSNSENGEVSAETIFHYSQEGRLVTAAYSGGGILAGSLIAVVDEEGVLDMRYQHVNERFELMTGKCVSRPEILPNGKIRLHEEWQWTCKDYSKGRSVIEEI